MFARNFVQHAFEHLEAARSEEKKYGEKNVFFLRNRLTVVDLFEDLWLVGDTFSLLAPVLGPL